MIRYIFRRHCDFCYLFQLEKKRNVNVRLFSLFFNAWVFLFIYFLLDFCFQIVTLFGGTNMVEWSRFFYLFIFFCPRGSTTQRLPSVSLKANAGRLAAVWLTRFDEPQRDNTREPHLGLMTPHGACIQHPHASWSWWRRCRRAFVLSEWWWRSSSAEKWRIIFGCFFF